MWKNFESYTFNTCNLLYINHTSVKLLFKSKFNTKIIKHVDSLKDYVHMHTAKKQTKLARHLMRTRN